MTLGGTNQPWDQNSNGSNVSNPYVYLLAVIEPGSFLLPAAPQPIAACLPKQQHCALASDFSILSLLFHIVFKSPFSTLLLLSHSNIVPSHLPCCDICCCLRGTPPGSEPKRHSVLTATSLVLRTPLDYSGTSVYRPIGVLVCKPPKGQVAPMSNMAPF